MIKAIIFDMDGTFVDTTAIDFETWGKTFREYGVNLSLERAAPLAIKLAKYGFKVALATGATNEKVSIIQMHIPLRQYFSIIVDGGDVTKGKPNPKIFLKTAEKLRVKPQTCLVFEDTLNGIKAAHNAGMKCIAITTTHTREELKEADRVIDSFDELTIETIKHLEGDKATTLAHSR